MKLKTSAVVLGLFLAGGAYALTTVTKQEGKEVVFTSSWYVSDRDRKDRTRTWLVTGNWYIAPGAGSGDVHGINGKYRHTVIVTKPGSYVASLSLRAGAATKMNCKVQAGGKVAKNPPGGDKNPGTGVCSVRLEFTVGPS